MQARGIKFWAAGFLAISLAGCGGGSSNHGVMIDGPAAADSGSSSQPNTNTASTNTTATTSSGNSTTAGSHTAAGQGSSTSTIATTNTTSSNGNTSTSTSSGTSTTASSGTSTSTGNTSGSSTTTVATNPGATTGSSTTVSNGNGTSATPGNTSGTTVVATNPNPGATSGSGTTSTGNTGTGSGATVSATNPAAGLVPTATVANGNGTSATATANGGVSVSATSSAAAAAAAAALNPAAAAARPVVNTRVFLSKNKSVFVYHTASKQVRELQALRGCYLRDVSADGSLFLCQTEGGEGVVYDAATNRLQKLTSIVADSFHDLSDDGQYVTYLQKTGRTAVQWVVYDRLSDSVLVLRGVEGSTSAFMAKAELNANNNVLTYTHWDYSARALSVNAYSVSNRTHVFKSPSSATRASSRPAAPTQFRVNDAGTKLSYATATGKIYERNLSVAARRHGVIASPMGQIVAFAQSPDTSPRQIRVTLSKVSVLSSATFKSAVHVYDKAAQSYVDAPGLTDKGLLTGLYCKVHVSNNGQWVAGTQWAVPGLHRSRTSIKLYSLAAEKYEGIELVPGELVKPDSKSNVCLR